MSRALPWISLALAAAALIATFSSGASERGDGARASEAEEEILALRDRLDALEASLSDIEVRLDERASPAGTQPLPAARVLRADGDSQEVLAQLAALRRDVDSLRADSAARAPESREQLKSAIASAQREMMAERFREHQARMAAERRDGLERFIAESDLSGAQADDLRRAIEDDLRATQENQEALRDREATLSPAERRQVLASQRESLRRALSQILDEAQLKAFEEAVVPQGRVVRPPPPAPVVR